ncbi:T9SS type A sorting domain-containing protein [Gynurincola endophyticus]|uniref:T9SS type A sorting domain-containing protein n=1 Tax=Gynurincola endophyticus TaxID=2479004 RepID=UPI000F8E4B21|nr:T9SS type A sorting domain-containing protein [Gynurincola endophyticus]
MRNILLLLITVVISTATCAQINYSALDFSSYKPYQHRFLYGVNLGYYGQSWDDKALADIAAGNTAKNVDGAGIRSFRPPLPGYFVDFYGYDVRLQEFEYFKTLGVEHNTIMLGWPSDRVRETYDYGCGENSKMFGNMYLPIWDNGENGTPYNDDNHYAAYVYEIVTRYKGYTKFWEVMNEPDFDIASQAWLNDDQPNNWWTNNPSPCALLNMKAPIHSYIRMLRISYEIIKTLDPDAYVCIGGIGYPSFLDAVLRNTDNPGSGAVTADFPLKGGAYFDVLSFHSYPMYKLGVWSNAANGFVYKRHSDEAAAVFIRDKDDLDEVLIKHGFDGISYPEKIWICTESNISRIRSESYIGSERAQLNYVLKAQVLSQKNKIMQHYLFVLGEPKSEANSSDPFDFMGLYKQLENTGPLSNSQQYRVTYTESGVGLRTMSTELLGFFYDSLLTTQLELNEYIDGAAFRDLEGTIKYVLWAKTTTDFSEDASYLYKLPASFDQTQSLVSIDWQGNEKLLNLSQIALNATPVIIKSPGGLLPHYPSKNNIEDDRVWGYKLYPNPVVDQLQFEYTLKENERVSLQIIHQNGSILNTVISNVVKPAGKNIEVINVAALSKGMYFIRIVTDKKYKVFSFVKQ